MPARKPGTAKTAATCVGSDFFGRREELESFAAVLQAARAGEARTVLLAGDPGIGKTRMAEEMASMAGRAGYSVVWGRWREGVRLPEVTLLRQVFRGLLRSFPPSRLGPGLDSALSELSAILPELRDEMPDLPLPLHDLGKQKSLRFLDAAIRLVRRASAVQPTMLVFDNLHLAAAQSLALLSGMIVDLSDCPLLLVATYRDLPVHRREPLLSFLSELRPMRSVQEYHLEPLSPEDTSAFAGYILGGTAVGDVVGEICRRTEGHPLFVRETARLVRHEIEHRGGTSYQAWDQSIPGALSVVVRLRVRQMSADSVDLLRKGAVIGKSFNEEELRLAGAATDGSRVEDLLEEAVAHGFLVHGDAAGAYYFSHTLLREAIQLQTPAPERRALCATLARAVERAFPDQLGSWALLLADWWGQVEGPRARRSARHFLRLAAETALEGGAWEEAVALYERVAGPKIENADNDETAADCLRLGTAYYNSGHRDTGIRLFQKAFSFYKQQGNTEAMITIATQQRYLLVGQPGFRNFFKEVLPCLPSRSRLEADVLHFEGVAVMLSVGDYGHTGRNFQRACEIGVEIGDPVTQARNLAGLGYVDYVSGNYQAAVEKASHALELLRGHEDPYAEGHASYVLGCALIALGRGGDALPFEDRMLEISLRLGDAVQIGTGSQLRARQAIMNGSWEEACSILDPGLAACPDHQFLLACRAFLEYTRGDFTAGDSFRKRILAVQRSTPTGPWCIHIQAASTATVRARNSGDTTELDRYVPQLRSIAAHPKAHPFILERAHLVLAFIAALTGDIELARERYTAILELPRLHLVRPYLRERILGLAAHTYGNHDKAVTHLEQALRMARHYGDRPMAGWILSELGEAVSPDGATTESVKYAWRRTVEAQDRAKEYSMPPLESRAEAALTRLSEFLERGEPAHLHLSRREIQVLELVAAGLTNQAIAEELTISTHTVANHITRILQKSGASNRTEAVSRARRLGVLS